MLMIDENVYGYLRSSFNCIHCNQSSWVSKSCRRETKPRGFTATWLTTREAVYHDVVVMVVSAHPGGDKTNELCQHIHAYTWKYLEKSVPNVSFLLLQHIYVELEFIGRLTPFRCLGPMLFVLFFFVHHATIDS